MPKTTDASKNPPNRNSAAAATTEVRLDAPLLQAIEEERARLMQVESLLDCMLVAMDNDDGDADDPYYPNVVELARELVNKVIGQLDTVRLKPLVQQIKDGTTYPLAEEKLQAGFGDHMVKEAGVLYVS